MLRQRSRRGLAAVALALAALTSGCDKNPVDAAIEAAIDFEGYFRADDGTEIELSGAYAYVRKVGTAVLGISLDVGDPYMMGMYPTGTPGEFSGYIVDRTGLLGRGTVRIEGNSLVVTSREYTAPTGQTSWQRATPSTPSTPGTPSTPPPSTPPSGSVTTLVNASGLEGDERSQRFWQFDVPSGTKEIRVTTTEDNQYGRNLGDIFIRRGSRPSASHHPYTWVADEKSIQPNREDELIVIPNPTAGTWHVLLYGYHEYWGTTLKVTITR